MYRLQSIFRFQLAVLAATAALGLVYLVFYRPLTLLAVARDREIIVLWDQLGDLNRRYYSSLGMDLETVRANRRLAEKSLVAIQKAAQRAQDRILLAQEWRDRVKQPFQLLDFDQKRQQLMGELQQAAQAAGVALGPTVASAYPEYQPGRDLPAQLWAEMFICDQISLSAVASHAKSFKSLTLLPIETHPALDGGTGVLDEFSVRIELAGTLESLVDFLRGLPLRPDELRALNLPVSSDAKPALFLNRLIVKRVPASPNEATLEAVVSGLVARDATAN